MALVWADGFDHYGTSTALALQAGYTQFAPSGIISTSPRTGTNCLQFTQTNFVYIRKILNTAVNTLGCGFGLYTNVTPGINYWGVRFQTGGSTSRLAVTIGTDLRILIKDLDNGTTLAQSNVNTIQLGTWQWIEIKAGIGAANGQGFCEVRVGGTTVVSLLNASFGTTQLNTVVIGYAGSTGGNTLDFRVDDFIIWDGTGSDNNDFLGDRRCITMIPTSDGATQNWTPVGSATGWGAIDEIPANITDYVEASNVNDVSEFGKSGLTVKTVGVAGIQLYAYAQKSDVGTATFRVGVNSNNVVQNSPTLTPGTSFGYFTYLLERDPNGSIPWTKAALEGAAFRVTRDS
jgi:hypothetical protein